MSPVTIPEVFEDFLVCPSNKEAVAAARAVAATEPDAPNPLMILGAPAEGKTHLVRALVAAFERRHPGVQTMVISTERLERKWRRAVTQQKLRQWQRELAGLGLLVIEDVQFLNDREVWEPLLGRVFSDLYARGGFVVLTRDPPAHAKPVDLPASIRVVSLHAPDFALRAAVAKRAAAEFGLTIPDDVAEFIAQHCENLRQVQGAVMRVHATTHLIRTPAAWSPSGWR